MSAPTSSSGLRAILLLFLAVLPNPASAQSAYGYYVAGLNGPATFESTTGVGGGVSLAVTRWLRLQADIDRRTNSFTMTGESCVNPTVDIGCVEDPIHFDASFGSLAVAVVPFWRPAPALEIGAGVGGLIGGTSSDVTPESGLNPKVFTKSSGNIGLVLLAETRILPVPDVPVFLTGRFQARRIDLQGCAAQEDLLDPFCGTDWWSEVHVGLGFEF